MTTSKDSRKTPILSVIIGQPRHYSTGVIADIRVGFRYWCDHMKRLEYYSTYDTEVTKFALGNLYLKVLVSGDCPEQEDGGSCRLWIRYEDLCVLDNEEQIKAMAQTLKYFKAKLLPMRWEKDPSPQFHEYVEVAVKLLKIKEAVLEDGCSKMPVTKAIKYIAEMAWKLRQRCQIMDGNLSTEEYAKKWCDRHNYSDLQMRDGFWMATPPNGTKLELCELF